MSFLSPKKKKKTSEIFQSEIHYQIWKLNTTRSNHRNRKRGINSTGIYLIPKDSLIASYLSLPYLRLRLFRGTFRIKSLDPLFKYTTDYQDRDFFNPFVSY